MDKSLVITEAPSPNAAWIEHEKDVGLNRPIQKNSKYKDRQIHYSEACKGRNARVLAGRDRDLTQGVEISDSTITASDGHPIRVRFYSPTIASEALNTEVLQWFVIYYHGGGLKVEFSIARTCHAAESARRLGS